MNYQEAEKIRNTGFADMMTKKLVSGQGVFRSFGGTISDKMKAKVKGVKQTFDPLNIAKKLTFGSKLGPAIIGKLTGRSSEDISFFTGVKGSMKRGADKGDPASKLGEIYKLMVDLENKRRIDQEIEKSFAKEKAEETENRNQEIIKALTGLYPSKKSRQVRRAEERKQKKEEEKSAKKESKETKETKGPEAKLPTPSPVKAAEEVAEKIGTTPVKAAEEVAEKSLGSVVKRVGEGVVGAARASAPAARAIVPVARVVAPVAILGAGSLSIGEALAKGESKNAGGYNAANMGTRNNKIVGIQKPVKLEEMSIAEIMRRQSIQWGAPNENEKLFAVGKYQMIPQTLADAVKSLHIDTSKNFDSVMQEKLFKDYLLGMKRPAIAKYLNSPTRDPKLLHDALKQLSLEWASVADPDIPGGKTSHYGSGNKASMTVEQATQYLESDRVRTQQVTTPPVDTGQRVDSLSKENAGVKKDLDKKSKDNITNNNNTIINNTSMQRQYQEPENDRSALEQKGRR